MLECRIEVAWKKRGWHLMGFGDTGRGDGHIEDTAH
jgi:hypothetical protein